MPLIPQLPTVQCEHTWKFYMGALWVTLQLSPLRGLLVAARVSERRIFLLGAMGWGPDGLTEEMQSETVLRLTDIIE